MSETDCRFSSTCNFLSFMQPPVSDMQSNDSESSSSPHKNGHDGIFYEGCGREGPIRCIFFSEFHPTAGPKITYQVPEDFVSKEIFDAVSVYIIPKPKLQRSILTINALGHKIVGYPVRIDNPNYNRNAFYFNLCFVCDAWARSVQYEPVVKKFAECLVTMERETGFLTNEKNIENLPSILYEVLEGLNKHRMVTVTTDTTVIHLKIVGVAEDPPQVYDHDVPLFVDDTTLFRAEEWDLTTQQLLHCVDGFNHVAKIAALADVENNLVKACIQNLVYYNVVRLLPIFQYSNVYVPTPLLHSLATNKVLQEECLHYVAKSDKIPNFSDVFRLYCSLNYGTTVRDLCLRFNPHTLDVDERRLVQFGLLRGLIRRLKKYPILLSDDMQMERSPSIRRFFTGSMFTDEICCKTGLSSQQLDELIERDSHVTAIWK